MNCHPRWDGRGDPRIYGGRWRSNLCRSWAFAKMHRFAARKSRMRAVGPLVPQGRGIGQPALLALEATHVHTIPQALPAWIESTASARVLQGRRACRHIAVRTLSPPGPTGSPACVGGGLGPRAEGHTRKDVAASTAGIRTDVESPSARLAERDRALSRRRAVSSPPSRSAGVPGLAPADGQPRRFPEVPSIWRA